MPQWAWMIVFIAAYRIKVQRQTAEES